MIMICAGTGLAPFRGFVAERAVLAREGGRKLAPALLFVGCRGPEIDRLYADELDSWAADGTVDIRYAFSRDPDHELAQGCKRIQERYAKDSDDVSDLFHKGAKVYVCGSGDFARDLGVVARKDIKEKMSALTGREATAEDVEDWMTRMRNERYVSDVFD
jgi:cytochrome P450/NADPH-cytochrome P450 reductase